MSKLKTTRVALALFAVCALVAMLNPAGVAVRARSEAPTPPNIRHHAAGAKFRRQGTSRGVDAAARACGQEHRPAIDADSLQH